MDRGVSPITLNATITGLKFFFEVTMSRPELMAKMRPVRVARTLPVILSREEASRLIESARTLEHRTALSVAYGAELRVSEVVALKVADIDSTRMVLRVEQGKGPRDRYALLPPILLERLRTWWRYARAEGKVLPGGYLFPGLDPLDSIGLKTPVQSSRPPTGGFAALDDRDWHRALDLSLLPRFTVDLRGLLESSKVRWRAAYFGTVAGAVCEPAVDRSPAASGRLGIKGQFVSPATMFAGRS